MKYINRIEEIQCAYCGMILQKKFTHITMTEDNETSFNEPRITVTCYNDICPQYNVTGLVPIKELEEL